MSTTKKPSYRYCLVPCCTNTTFTAPDKLFLSVPRDKRRGVWEKVMKRDVKKSPALSSKTSRHVCEDHFSLEEDLENYWEWKLMGRNFKRLKFKDGVVPHIFECQKKTLSPPVRKGALKRKRITLVQAAFSAVAELSKSQTFRPVSVKEEPLSTKSSYRELLEKNSAANANPTETNSLKPLNNSTHKKHKHIEVLCSTSEPSFRIVTSQFDENSDSDESDIICNELIAPIQRFYCDISEDAVLSLESSSVQNHLPSDFSTNHDIITSEEKIEKFLNTDETKPCSKKPCKPKKNWSKEEDQLIISYCQKYGINQRAFCTSADEIGSVTPVEVKQRFIYLLELLSKKLKNGK